jgi:hypothetical protein
MEVDDLEQEFGVWTDHGDRERDEARRRRETGQAG